MRNELTGLSAGLFLTDLGDKRAADIFGYYKKKSVQKVRSRVEYLKRMLTVKIKEVEEETKQDVGKQYDFYEDAVQLQYVVDRPIDIHTATLREWISWNKLAKKIIKNSKKNVRN